jgi:WD40 repeat protein
MPGMGAVYDSASGEVLATLDIQADAEVEDIAFLDEERLAVCVAETGLRIWDIATGTVSLQHDFVSSRLTSDGRLTLGLDAVEEFYVYRYLHSFEVRETLSGELIRKVTFNERIPLKSWDFDPEGDHVIINSFRDDFRYNAPILAYSISTGELVADTRQAASIGFYMRPITGLRVLMSGFGPQIYLWDLNRTGERRVAEQSGEIYHIDMTSDGSLALTTDAPTGQVHLRDLTAGNVTAVFEAPTAGEPRRFHDVSISDDGSVMLAISSDQIYRLDPVRGVDVLLESPLGEGVAIFDMQVSGDGSRVIIAGEEEACVFNTADARRVYSTEGEGYADISTDGRVALVGERIIHLDTGIEQTIDEMTSSRTELSDDGNHILDFYFSRGSTIWNSTTLARLEAAPIGWEHASHLNSPWCDLSADGRYTVSADLREQVFVYDAHEQKVVAVLAIDDTGFRDIVISGDGSTVLIATQTGRLHHFRLDNLPGAL